MNLEQALEHANNMLAPQLLFDQPDQNALWAERERNEEAIVVLRDAWMSQPSPSFSFDLVRHLADHNRQVCDGLDEKRLRKLSPKTLTRSLSDGDIVRSIAALQGRSVEDVRAETQGQPDNFGIAYVSHPVKGTVVGIDIETTGIDPARSHIINCGWEFTELAKRAKPHDAFAVFFGLPDVYEERGVPLENIHHITWDMVASESQLRNNEKAQHALVTMLETYPYVAHNAAFEDSWFMLHLDGYAEARKEGRITPIDSRDICRRIDPDARTLPRESKPATLENWARRRGTLKAGEKERHLGLEDVDLMLATMQAEFKERNMY